MHVLLFLGGLIAIAAGCAALYLGINDYRLEGPGVLILPGTVAVIGGLALCGLGSIAARLHRLADALEAQPLPRSVAFTPPGAPREPSAAISGEAARAAAPAEPSVGERDPSRTAPPIVVDAPLAGGTPHGATEPLSGTLNDAPAAPIPSVSGPAAPVTEADAGEAEPAEAIEPVRGGAADQQPPAPKDATPTILKSGVIEGMAYTLYSDGSVEAELPQQGTMRFASIAEWRAYVRGESGES